MITTSPLPTLCDSPKHIGMAMRFHRQNGTPVLLWVRVRDLGPLTEGVMRRFTTIARKYEIPADEYHKYPFLN